MQAVPLSSKQQQQLEGYLEECDQFLGTEDDDTIDTPESRAEPVARPINPPSPGNRFLFEGQLSHVSRPVALLHA